MPGEPSVQSAAWPDVTSKEDWRQPFLEAKSRAELRPRPPLKRIRSKLWMAARHHAAWFLLYLCLTFVIQWRAGAYFDDFSATSDEPAHFSSALAIHDYLSDGFRYSPVEFLYRMYARYPKIAIGHWPPGFYLIMALWMFLLGTTRTSVLILIALFAAVAAEVIRASVRNCTTPAAAAVSPLLGLLLPASSLYIGSVMLEVPLVLFGAVSAYAVTRLLETHGWSWAIWAGLSLSAAICTKGNALALVPAYVVAVITAAGWKSLFRIRFVIPLVITAVLCAPVYLLSLKATAHFSRAHAGIAFTTLAMKIYPVAVWHQFGPVLITVIGIGLVWVSSAPNERHRPIWIVATCWLVFTIVFHLPVPTGIELRYFAVGLPPICWFGAAGISALEHFRRPLGWTALTAVLCVCATNLAQIHWRARGGMAAAIQTVLDLGGSQMNKGVFVAGSDASGEGRAIAEGFESDRHHRFVFLRATQYISESDWMGRQYSLRLHGPVEVEKQLRSIPASFIVVQHQHSKFSNEVSLTEDTVNRYTSEWTRVFHRYFRISDNDSETIDVYYSKHNSELALAPVLVNLKANTGEIFRINLQ